MKHRKKYTYIRNGIIYSGDDAVNAKEEVEAIPHNKFRPIDAIAAERAFRKFSAPLRLHRRQN